MCIYGGESEEKEEFELMKSRVKRDRYFDMLLHE